MSNHPIDDDELTQFKAAVQGARKLKQDTIRAPQQRIKPNQRLERSQSRSDTNKTTAADSLFSDQYEPLLPSEGPMRYLRDGAPSHQLKQLRRGDFVPELFLDLHGMSRAASKPEILALIQACLRDHHPCAAIMFGHGQGILKQQVPRWLVQHPQLVAFHQAPREWGGGSALLILVDVEPLR